jgi:hypothetical protein
LKNSSISQRDLYISEISSALKSKRLVIKWSSFPFESITFNRRK